MSRILCMGDLGVDFYSKSNQRFVGGQAFNVAYEVAKFAVDDVVLSTAIGNDAMAQTLTQKVADTSVSLEVAKVDGKTPEVEIILDGAGERRYGAYEPGVLEDWVLSEWAVESIAEAEYVVVPAYPGLKSLAAQVAAEVAKLRSEDDSVQRLLFCDLSDLHGFDRADAREKEIRWALGLADVVLLSGGTDWEQWATLAQKEYSEKLLIVTLGGAGAKAYWAGKELTVGAKEVQTIVDTTGAGDAVMAHVLLGFAGADIDAVSKVTPEALQKWLEAGAVRAAEIIGKKGAVPELGPIT